MPHSRSIFARPKAMPKTRSDTILNANATVIIFGPNAANCSLRQGKACLFTFALISLFAYAPALTGGVHGICWINWH
jgi:hypothetical protein